MGRQRPFLQPRGMFILMLWISIYLIIRQVNKDMEQEG